MKGGKLFYETQTGGCFAANEGANGVHRNTVQYVPACGDSDAA
jgi:hypothetical protein